ncbi:MAG TPA: hypothetical protein PKD10_11005 [Paracoccaceae bacterium]|nr:hypothetical protein [Paracoccaceae bacterium]
MNLRNAAFLVLGSVALSGCFAADGIRPYVESPDTVIATATDKGFGPRGLLPNGQAAIAYDPDGCQNWILDDGPEGYASPRFDPATGLPVCNNHFPPGAVVRGYQTSKTGLRDYGPGTSGP